MSLTVACVLKSGGIYDATWVARLKASVAKYLPIEHRFVCLSDVDVPCERIPLEHDWPGWWSKIELFKLPGPVLYFDLDTAIVSDLSSIAKAAQNSQESRLLLLRDFYRPNGYGSGVMAWSAYLPRSPIYSWFKQSSQLWMEKFRGGGDQSFIEDWCNEEVDGVRPYDHSRACAWQDIVGDQIVSYKVHCRNGIPANARVVALHGQPKFGDMPVTDPVRTAWEMAA